MPPPKQQQRLIEAFVASSREYAVILMGPDGVVTDWLGAAPAIFGYSAEEVVGSTLALIFLPEDRARGLDRYELALAAANSRSEDDRWHQRRDGSRIWATGTVMAVRDAHGGLVGFVKLVRDRTDLKMELTRLETENSRLEDGRTRTHAFLRTLGHEIRGPLAPLSDGIQLVRRMSTDERLDPALGILQRQVEALRRLADDLADLTGLESGQVALRLEPADLRDVLRDGVRGFEPAAARRGVSLEAVLPDAELPVSIDRARFERLVSNLLDNALKYTPSGGKVWVKATREGDEIVFEVEDTGVGIPPAVLPRLFELFTRAPQTGDAPSGLGIGLAVVQQIARLHEGSVQARSGGEGRGAQLAVRLPVRRGG